MLQILRDIYSDLELANNLGFKGGTALMFFYGLPRFSVDLDFDLIRPDKEKENTIYQKIHNILLKYGKIEDEAQKFFGPILVLNYGKGERKMKMSFSNYLQNCIETLNHLSDNNLLNGIGDLIDDHKLKNFVRNKLRNETITLLKFYKEFPIV